jgi:hypothetical protein
MKVEKIKVELIKSSPNFENVFDTFMRELRDGIEVMKASKKRKIKISVSIK